jgi:hypothetical protein
MHLRYDEDLVEAAVLLCARGHRAGISSLQIARFYRERDKLYGILEPDDRNAAFFQLHLEWFREWGLEKLLAVVLAEYPLLQTALNLLAFRMPRARNDEGAELYVNEAGERSGVVALRPAQFEQETTLAAFLRHEFMHLHDMLDPQFAYRPELRVSGPSLNQKRLALERYRLLWDVTIDARLSRAQRQSNDTREQRWAEFTVAFAFWPESRQQQVFHSLWENSAPTHRVLEELVCDPLQLVSADGPRPGARCPLCGFPTFAWASEHSLPEPAVLAIRREFPHWSPEHGACARCAAIYRVNTSQPALAV